MSCIAVLRSIIPCCVTLWWAILSILFCQALTAFQHSKADSDCTRTHVSSLSGSLPLQQSQTSICSFAPSLQDHVLKTRRVWILTPLSFSTTLPLPCTQSFSPPLLFSLYTSLLLSLSTSFFSLPLSLSPRHLNPSCSQESGVLNTAAHSHSRMEYTAPHREKELHWQKTALGE